jgi:hypothetical protein
MSAGDAPYPTRLWIPLHSLVIFAGKARAVYWVVTPHTRQKV